MQDEQHAPPGPPGVDLDQARQFLNLLDPRGVFTFQTFSDREELKQTLPGRDGKPRPFDPFAKVFHGTLDQRAAALIALNKQGVGVFVMINEGDGIVKPLAKTCRTTANVIRVRALFVDLDGAPLPPVLTGPLPPDWIVQSSPGRWHAYWRVQNCALNKFSAAQVALAVRYGGDQSVKDLPRVMRLPGFAHQKGAPFISQVYIPDEYPALREGTCEQLRDKHARP